MRVLSLICLSILFVLNPVQSGLESSPVKGLKLNSPLTDFQQSVYLITGDEDIYKKYDWLRESLLNNIKNGIREGIYSGTTLDIISGNKASKMTLFFYKEELYKVRWSFSKRDYPNLDQLTQNIDQYLLNKYGEMTEKGSYGERIWRDEKIHLQSLGDESEYQIEYRDEQIHLTTEGLN